jgi:hypothetical protein
MPYGSERYGGGSGPGTNPGWMGGGAQSPSTYVPRGGPSYGGSKKKVVKQAVPVLPASTNPTTRAPEPITNSNAYTGSGGIVDSENRPGGRKRRMASTSFASSELLG